jgi:phage gpG-like protein
MAEGFEGFEQVARRVGQLITDVRHVERPLNEAGEYLVGSVRRNFLEQGRPTKWTSLAKSTIASRLRDSKGKSRGSRGRHRSAGGMKILLDTTDMMKAVDKSVTTDGVRVGLNKVQAARQHFGFPGGTGRGHAKTPARPFLMMQPEDQVKIGNIFIRHIARK